MKNEIDEDVFAVKRIAGTKLEGKERYYLVEWDGYDLSENTWEEEDNIYSANAIAKFMQDYRRQKHLNKNANLQGYKKLLLRNTYDPDTKSYYPRKPDNFVHSILPKPSTIKRITTSVTATTTSTEVTQTNIASSVLIKQENRIQKRVRETIESETESVLISKPAKVKNPTRESKTRAFEDIVNSVKRSVENKFPVTRLPQNGGGKGSNATHYIKNLKAKVTILNEVDMDLPTNFVYIDDLKYTHPVQPPDPDFLPGCSCSKLDGCTEGCHDVVAYDSNGKLLINQGTAIYECNQSCECSTDCKNRVVQHGRKIPLQVYKTKTKGWAVKSVQFIPKGTFIEEYIGEVISVQEGDRRGQVYDRLGCSYLFDMDFAQSELPTKYVIDSYALGNVSRFFNHSCSPNLEVYAVFYDSADNQMHRLAFFAKRDIQKNEELCFDYNGRRDVSNQAENEGASRYACHCDSSECRKWIYL